ncbi:MAG: 3-hydroxyacyl-ACP dehydratase FabZ [Gammaproteobacteria bacterium]|nr:3-hydroxyacyl-ACP dehydratase FabZ [Gammaproteobacteria bacterium]
MQDLTIDAILHFMPHRYPFLLIDRIEQYVPNKSITALKNVTINEPFFQGHFPGNPIMPGVLILESMAQATGMLAFYSDQEHSSNERMYYLAGIDKARFRKPVRPGDTLRLTAELNRYMRGIYKFSAAARVDDELVAEAELLTSAVER